MKNPRLPAVCLLFFFLYTLGAQTPPGSEEQSDPYGPELVLAFADSLAAAGDNREAAWEYERYLFLRSNPESSAVIALASIYKNRGEGGKTLSIIDTYLPLTVDPPSRNRLLVLKGYTLLEMKDWRQLDSLLASPEIRSFDGLTFRALETGGLVRQKKYPEARGVCSVYFADTAKGSLDSLLTAYRPKSPSLALALSGLIPGLGKAYAGQYGDAFFSLLTVAALGSFAAYTWHTEGASSWRPWAYGISAGFFYSANLYGSHQAALRFNSFQETRIREASDALGEKYQN